MRSKITVFTPAQSRQHHLKSNTIKIHYLIKINLLMKAKPVSWRFLADFWLVSMAKTGQILGKIEFASESLRLMSWQQCSTILLLLLLCKVAKRKCTT